MALNLLEDRTEGVSPVIPVRLEETEVPKRLRDLQWIDLFSAEGKGQLERALTVARA